jgi:crotonobetainyl-CoA:carnitine CoA-transferase CaiB-like acyl-CoA transferase
VRSVGEAIRSMEARERKLVTRLEHPELGWLPNVSLPFRFSETPVADPRPAPGIGENSHAVLTEVLGYDAATAAALIESGSVYSCPAPVPAGNAAPSGSEVTT